MANKYSIVEWYNENEGHRCGYCKSPDTNKSHGMWAHHLTVEDYQALIDRGWRRSGKYVYKPTMKMTCCPQYPIRCHATDFQISKSQKKVIKRVNKYLSYGIKPKCDPLENVKSVGVGMSDFVSKENANSTEDFNELPLVKELGSLMGEEVGSSTTQDLPSISGMKKVIPNKYPKPGKGMDESKPLCQKAKVRRLEKKKEKQKLLSSELEIVHKKEKNMTNQKTLEDYLNEVVENPAHKLEIRLVRSSPQSAEFKRSSTECHLIYQKYQTTIHKDPPEKPSVKQYNRFLVDSPLLSKAVQGHLPEGYGSFHQQYVLDGNIIAVGVIDILPNCVSSVYLYYDPDYSFLTLGTYSALREMAFTRSLHAIDSNISHYYLGFYIHSCPKMRYKGQYTPSDLLCPETYTWHPIDACRLKLDTQKYSRFANSDVVDSDGSCNVDEVIVLYKSEIMPYRIYRGLNKKAKDAESVSQYASFVGKTCSKRILLFRN